MASEAEPVAYLHTLNMEGGQTYERLTMFNGIDPDEARVTAFGLPGRDYSEEYSVSTTPLYERSTEAADEITALRDRVAALEGLLRRGAECPQSGWTIWQAEARANLASPKGLDQSD